MVIIVYELKRLGDRLKKIGIDIEFVLNIPFVYVSKINGERVSERYKSDFGFICGYQSVRIDGNFRFENKRELFKLIRRYI